MKTKIVALSLVLASTVGLFAQGTVNWSMRVPGIVVAPIYGVESGNSALSKSGNTAAGVPAGVQTYTGTLLNGSNFRAELFYAAGTGVAEASLVGAANSITTFRTSATLAGTVAPLAVTLAGTSVGGSATLQARVWDNTSGLYPDWASAQTAWLAGTIAAGKGVPFDITGLADASNPAAPDLTGLRSFNIYVNAVPEPTSFALAGLGAAALLIFRRRK